MQCTMQRPIGDHVYISDGRMSALVADDGTVDWLCAPRFDTAPAFASLLGDERNGAWTLRPQGAVRSVGQRYAGDGLIAETDLRHEGGTIRLVDAVAHRNGRSYLVRIVRGIDGAVPVRCEVSPRPDFGSLVPYAIAEHDAIVCYGGGFSVAVRGSVPLTARDGTISASFAVRRGDVAWFTATWFEPQSDVPAPIDVHECLSAIAGEAARWTARLRLPAFGAGVARRSAAILRGLTYAPTGALVAAATTSLPERVHGPLNWDYRFSWVRDTAFGIEAFLAVGAVDEAARALDWLLRASAGRPSSIRTAYAIDGTRRIQESIVHELPGYRDSKPVRAGNAAATQVQLDAFGEIILSAMRVESAGRHLDAAWWDATVGIGEELTRIWRGYGHGVWEIRGAEQQYLTDRVMTCVGLRALASGALRRAEHERAARFSEVAAEVDASIRRDYVLARRSAFATTQGLRRVGATSLWPVIMGLTEPDDPLAAGTIGAIERDLVRGALVYRTAHDLPRGRGRPREGAFLPCTGWLARAYARCGRLASAQAAFESLTRTANAAGIFSEEYDVQAAQMLGNVPQAFTHAEAMIAARALSDAGLQDDGSPCLTPPGEG